MSVDLRVSFSQLAAASAAIAALLLIPSIALAQRKAQPEQPPVSLAQDTLAWSRLSFRYIGPEGNRISIVTAVICLSRCSLPVLAVRN